jgi:hypothetical protein
MTITIGTYPVYSEGRTIAATSGPSTPFRSSPQGPSGVDGSG